MNDFLVDLMAQLVIAERNLSNRLIGPQEVAALNAVARAKEMLRDIPSGDAIEDQAERKADGDILSILVG